MMGSINHRHHLRTLLLGLAMLAGVGLTGCQIDTGGQTCPARTTCTTTCSIFRRGRSSSSPGKLPP